MPYSHHSHSGEYVAHGENTLDEVITKVKQMNFHVFCLTEHCPRYARDLMYPEEEGMTVESLTTIFDKYMVHARRIQKEINNDDSNRLRILVGFESEGGIDEIQTKGCEDLRKKYNVDIVVGSIHYVKRIPIDFDRPRWIKAKQHYNSFRDFFKGYFQCQHEMIKRLKPEVVSHFDLIRLLEEPESDRCEITGKLLKNVNIKTDWPEVWKLIDKNIDLINEQGGLIELNSAALRKGWNSPYPKRDIVELALSKGAKFCMSDDSHGIAQVGFNYDKVLKFIQSFGDKMPYIYYWNVDKDGNKMINKREVSDLADDPFWGNYSNL
ncbi:hypothetical protein BRETT_001058 [Brettanomyces bruxellensis]|uniref:Histidinol-phosphatase n=1 Tax=Dekkera bruxellensis TaxID=5007 RepID=A0A871R7T7_DEKBR|nr:uncharacterized protein BRETT_001058 [Brettanomyces bruxellensis]QOU21336.1 hypothetical protein BRETT_001058 [Brettanomyces bruxellensis]